MHYINKKLGETVKISIASYYINIQSFFFLFFFFLLSSLLGKCLLGKISSITKERIVL